MRTRATLLGLVFFLGQGVLASAGGLTMRVGGFWPRGDSTLFDDVESLYTRGDPNVGVSASDFNGWTGGIEYSVAVMRNFEVGLHADYYSKNVQTSLRDYVEDNGREIYQSLRLRIAPVGASLRIVPTGRHVKVAPYLAGGIDAFFWKYEEWGDFVDFFSRDLVIIEDWFLADGVAFGGHVAGGIRFAINDDLFLVGEGRYQFAEQDMGDDFRGSRIDLSGASATVGLHLRF